MKFKCSKNVETTGNIHVEYGISLNVSVGRYHIHLTNKCENWE